MRSGPGKAVAVRWTRQLLIEDARGRAARERHGERAILRRRRREQPIRHAARQRLGIGENFQLGLRRARHIRILLNPLESGANGSWSGLLASPAHSPSGRKMNLCAALAKPSFSLLSVTALACVFTSSLALPMAMEKPLLRNMSTSFGMSPMVAICAGAMPSRAAMVATTVPLLAFGWVTSR